MVSLILVSTTAYNAPSYVIEVVQYVPMLKASNDFVAPILMSIIKVKVFFWLTMLIAKNYNRIEKKQRL